MVVFLIGVVICPRTAVPVGTDQDACGSLRIVTGDDIRCVEHGAVVAFQVGFLCLHLTAVLLELFDNPLFAFIVCFGVHDAWSELALHCTEEIGGVGIELWSCRLFQCQRVAISAAAFHVVAGGTATEEHQEGEWEKDMGFHFLL